MKKIFIPLLLVGMVSVACSQTESAGMDLGTAQDLAGTPDLAVEEPASTLTLSLVSGSLGGAGNVNGSGSAARFYDPPNVAADGLGNVYVADAGNNTIRKVVVATGAVTTLAGTTGQTGSSDGTGPAARFSVPFGLALDGAGNLYVTDYSDHTIRKVVVATGTVTTLAGNAGKVGSTDGTGSAARFNRPAGVAVDGAGNLYVADSSNQTIRKVVVATGAVTTLAGTTGQVGSTDGIGSIALFNYPKGVAVDGAGNLFVADTGNSTLRKVLLATGAVTTLAGTAGQDGSTDGAGLAARFNRPAGVAVDGAGSLYVTDTNNSTLRKVVVATGAVSTLAGTAFQAGSVDDNGPAARFRLPTGVAVDGTGNLYLADASNNTIRKVVVATGAVTTLAGTASLVGSVDGTGSAVRFYGPVGVAADGAGNLYLAESASYTIRKVVLATGAVTTLAGTAGSLGSADGTGTAARFDGPAAVAVDGVGNLNGDYESAYNRTLTTTCTSWNHEHSVYSAKRPALLARSAA